MAHSTSSHLIHRRDWYLFLVAIDPHEQNKDSFHLLSFSLLGCWDSSSAVLKKTADPGVMGFSTKMNAL